MLPLRSTAPFVSRSALLATVSFHNEWLFVEESDARDEVATFVISSNQVDVTGSPGLVRRNPHSSIPIVKTGGGG